MVQKKCSKFLIIDFEAFCIFPNLVKLLFLSKLFNLSNLQKELAKIKNIINKGRDYIYFHVKFIVKIKYISQIPKNLVNVGNLQKHFSNSQNSKNQTYFKIKQKNLQFAKICHFNIRLKYIFLERER